MPSHATPTAAPKAAPAHTPTPAQPIAPPLMAARPLPAARPAAARRPAAPTPSALAQLPGFVQEKVSAYAHDFAGYRLLAQGLGYDPLTGRAVPAAPQAVAHALLGLLPDGAARYQQLQAAGPALARLPAWLGQQLAARQLSGARLTQVLAETWSMVQGLDFGDLLEWEAAARRLARPWLALARDVAGFVVRAEGALLRWLVQAVLGEAQAAPVLRALDQGGDLLARILRHPLPFLQHLVHAGWHGFRNFLTNGPRHLLASVQDWLLGGLAKAGLRLPARLDLAGVIDLLLQVFDLTKAAVLSRLRQRLMAVLGAANVGRVEELLARVGGVALTLWQRGPAAAWQAISQQAGDLKAQALDFVQQQVLGVAAKAVPVFLATLAVPGGAFVQVARGIYNGVMTFVEKGRQIAQVGTALLGSLSAIAAGQLAPAAQAVETTLVKVLPVALSFLARWLGLDGISGAIQNGLKKVQAPVEKAVGKVLDVVTDKAKAVWGAVKAGAGKVVAQGRQVAAAVGDRMLSFFGVRKKFETDLGEKHSLYFSEKNSRTQLIIESTPTEIRDFLKQYIATDKQKTQAYKDVVEHLDKYEPYYDTLTRLATQAQHANDSLVKKQLFQQENAVYALLLIKNDTLARMLTLLLKGDRQLGGFWDKYELEGLTGKFKNLPNAYDDLLTPDHQPNVATLKAAAKLTSVTGQPLYTDASPLKQLTAGENNHGNEAYTILLHNEQRHKPGRTYTYKGGIVARAFTARVTQLYQAVTSDESRRNIVAQELRQEARSDAEAIRKVIQDDANWTDLTSGHIKPALSDKQRRELRQRITARIMEGERQIENQPIEPFKKEK